MKFVKMPDWVSTLPEEAAAYFEFCAGRVYRVAEVFVLDVSSEIDRSSAVSATHESLDRLVAFSPDSEPQPSTLNQFSTLPHQNH
jgi:hypothetical protein